MDVWDILLHGINFAAPAAAMALLVAFSAQFYKKKGRFAQYIWAQAAINFVACLAVLVAGLWFFGRDGKLATYSAMVLVAATLQCWLSGAGRK